MAPSKLQSSPLNLKLYAGDIDPAESLPNLENGRLSDRNRIAADTHVSNRIEIGRNDSDP